MPFKPGVEKPVSPFQEEERAVLEPKSLNTACTVIPFLVATPCHRVLTSTPSLNLTT
jgi:O6-methylguanine-DNA--protein-cysteine methyltransferase